MALCLAQPAGRASSTSIASAIATAVSNKEILRYLKSSRIQVSSWHSASQFHEVGAICFGPRRPISSPENPVSSDFAVTIPGCKTSPTDFVAFVAAALVVSAVPDQDDPASPSPEDSATASPHVALCFAFTNNLYDCCNADTVPTICSGPRRPTFTRRHSDFGVCRSTLLCDSRRRSFAKPCCCNPGTRCALCNESPVPPEDTATLGSVVLCFLKLGRPNTVVPATEALYFTSSRGTFPICSAVQPARQTPVAPVHAGQATPRRQSLPGIEVHPQFARRSTVAPVHVDLHHQGIRRRLPTPFETTLVSSVFFSPSGSNLHTSSHKKRHSLAMR